MDMMDPMMGNAMGMMMMYSMIIARLLGPLCVVLGLGILLNQKYFKDMVDELAKGKQQFLLFGAGIVHFLFGLILIGTHNVWMWNWAVIITIIGWASLIRGVVLLLLPNAAMSILGYFRKQSWWLPVAGVIALVIGVVLSYFGFGMRMM